MQMHLQLQPEGETDWVGASAALVKTAAAPVIVKEVGAGITAHGPHGCRHAPFFDWGVDCLRAAMLSALHGLDAAKIDGYVVAAAGPMLAHLVADDAALDLSKLQDFVSLETADGIDIIFDWGVKSGGIQAGRNLL